MDRFVWASSWILSLMMVSFSGKFRTKNCFQILSNAVENTVMVRIASNFQMGSFVRCLEDDPYEHYVDDHYESRIAKPMVPSPVFPESQTYPRSFLGYRKRLRYQQEPKRRGVYAKSSIHELGPIAAPPPYAAFYNGANPSATTSEKIQYDNNNNQYQSYPAAVPTYGNGYGSPNNYVQGKKSWEICYFFCEIFIIFIGGTVGYFMIPFYIYNKSNLHI